MIRFAFWAVLLTVTGGAATQNEVEKEFFVTVGDVEIYLDSFQAAPVLTGPESRLSSLDHSMQPARLSLGFRPARQEGGCTPRKDLLDRYRKAINGLPIRIIDSTGEAFPPVESVTRMAIVNAPKTPQLIDVSKPSFRDGRLLALFLIPRDFDDPRGHVGIGDQGIPLSQPLPSVPPHAAHDNLRDARNRTIPGFDACLYVTPPDPSTVSPKGRIHGVDVTIESLDLGTSTDWMGVKKLIYDLEFKSRKPPCDIKARRKQGSDYCLLEMGPKTSVRLIHHTGRQYLLDEVVAGKLSQHASGVTVIMQKGKKGSARLSFTVPPGTSAGDYVVRIGELMLKI